MCHRCGHEGNVLGKMHYYTEEETQWTIQRRQEAPAEPWANVLERFKEVFPLGEQPTVNSLQVRVSLFTDGNHSLPYTADENQWLIAYRPLQLDPQSIAEFHEHHHRAFPEVARSKEALIRHCNRLGFGWRKKEVGRIAAKKSKPTKPKSWHRDWTDEESQWISASHYDGSRSSYKKFLQKFSHCTFTTFKGRVQTLEKRSVRTTNPRAYIRKTRKQLSEQALKIEKSSRTLKGWSEDENTWLRSSCPPVGNKEAFEAFKKIFPGRSLSLFSSKRRNMRLQGTYFPTSSPTEHVLEEDDPPMPCVAADCCAEYLEEGRVVNESECEESDPSFETSIGEFLDPALGK